MTHRSEVVPRLAKDAADSGRKELGTLLSPAAFSVPEFCKEHRISRALFYILQKNGAGPRLMRVRRRTLVTADAAAEWRRRMEDETNQGAA